MTGYRCKLWFDAVDNRPPIRSVGLDLLHVLLELAWVVLLQPFIRYFSATLMVARKSFIQLDLKAERLTRILSLQHYELHKIVRKAKTASVGLSNCAYTIFPDGFILRRGKFVDKSRNIAPWIILD